MSRKKIFYALSVFLILGAMMSGLSVRAHSPINIDIEYYDATALDVDLREKLVIRLTHGVSDPKEHYIYEIDVWINQTQRWVEHGSQGKYEHHGIYYWDLDNYGVAILPLGEPNYTFTYTEQPTHVTPITISHTLPIYRLSLPGLTKTGEIIDNPEYDANLERVVAYLKDAGRTNITVDVKCNKLDWEGEESHLVENYYVGLPYYNPHLTFAEAAIPATVSTIIVIVLLFTLPLAGQKSLPKLKDGKFK